MVPGTSTRLGKSHRTRTGRKEGGNGKIRSQAGGRRHGVMAPCSLWVSVPVRRRTRSHNIKIFKSSVSPRTRTVVTSYFYQASRYRLNNYRYSQSNHNKIISHHTPKPSNKLSTICIHGPNQQRQTPSRQRS